MRNVGRLHKSTPQARTRARRQRTTHNPDSADNGNDNADDIDVDESGGRLSTANEVESVMAPARSPTRIARDAPPITSQFEPLSANPTKPQGDPAHPQPLFNGYPDDERELYSLFNPFPADA